MGWQRRCPITAAQYLVEQSLDVIPDKVVVLGRRVVRVGTALEGRGFSMRLKATRCVVNCRAQIVSVTSPPPRRLGSRNTEMDY